MMMNGPCNDQRLHTPMPVPHPHGPVPAPPAPPLPADPLPPVQEPPSEQPPPITDPPPAPLQGGSPNGPLLRGQGL